MDIKTFKVERWMNEYEEDCTYNLAETCIDSLTVRELTEMAGLDTAAFMDELADTRLIRVKELSGVIRAIFGDYRKELLS